MTIESPFNLRLTSIARFDDAMAICDLLQRETSNAYTFVPDNYLGFTARRRRENKQKQQQNSVKTVDHNKRFYCQAFRSFILHYSELGTGVLLIAHPYSVLGCIFAWLNIETILEGFSLPGWSKVVKFSGFFLILYGLRFIYSDYAIKFWFDDDGFVLKKGIIAQDQVQICFGDIKTIGVHQSILDRLPGTGTLHLGSAGTNGMAGIVFNNLINPVYMRRRLQQLIDQSAMR